MKIKRRRRKRNVSSRKRVVRRRKRRNPAALMAAANPSRRRRRVRRTHSKRRVRRGSSTRLNPAASASNIFEIMTNGVIGTAACVAGLYLGAYIPKMFITDPNSPTMKYAKNGIRIAAALLSALFLPKMIGNKKAEAISTGLIISRIASVSSLDSGK